MKGQFFVLAAILLASLFFVGLPITGNMVGTVSEDLDLLSGNIASEFPAALNRVLPSGDLGRMGDFSLFLEGQLEQRNADFANLWLVTQPDGGGLNVTLGNYLGEDITVAVNVSDNLQMLYMPSGTMDSLYFASVPQDFPLRVGFADVDRHLQLERDKVNLYAFFSISRGSELLRKEVIA
jgi:hypothetical protein